MQTDPFEARRTGAHRLRVVTASIGAAAVVGTGALAWSVAATHRLCRHRRRRTGPTGRRLRRRVDSTSNGDDAFNQSVDAAASPQTSTLRRHRHASSGGS